MELVLGIVKDTAFKIRPSPNAITKGNFKIDSSYLRGIHRYLNNLTLDSIKELVSLEVILIDPVYIRKVLAGMLYYARSG